MEKALRVFYNEYIMFLEGVKSKMVEAIAKTIKVKHEIDYSNPSQKMLNELDRIRRGLFQTNYLLMESHIRLPNPHPCFSDEENKSILEYEDVSRQANNIIKRIDEFLNSFKKEEINTNNL